MIQVSLQLHSQEEPMKTRIQLAIAVLLATSCVEDFEPVNKFTPSSDDCDERTDDCEGEGLDSSDAGETPSNPNPDQADADAGDEDAGNEPDVPPDDATGEGEGEGEGDLECIRDEQCNDIGRFCTCADEQTIRCHKRSGLCISQKCEVIPVLESSCPEGCDFENHVCKASVCPENHHCCTDTDEDLSPPCNGCPTNTAIPQGSVCIPPGEFHMGSPEEEDGRESSERLHAVRITRPFIMEEHEIAQHQWLEVMGSNPSNFADCENCPVENVSWVAVIAYANTRSLGDGLDPCYQTGDGQVYEVTHAEEGADVIWPDEFSCNGWRLPTEAEWEYANRAHTQTPWFCGQHDCLVAVAWYHENAGGHTHEMCQLDHNGWGLCDTLGNVLEWVWDLAIDYGGVEPEPIVDPTGPSDGGPHRIVKGGHYNSTPASLRSAYRHTVHPHNEVFPVLGARLARSVPLED